MVNADRLAAQLNPSKQQRMPKRRLTFRLTPAFDQLVAITRNMGVGVSGTRGVGKSTLLFLFTLLDTLYYGKTTIVITPIPQVIDLFFTLICTLREHDQQRIWPHMRYINLSGYEVVPDAHPLDWYVLPTPAYYQSGIGRDSSFVMASRLPEIFLKIDPNLKEAPVQGYRALENAAVAGGRILVTLGLGVSHLADLIRFPESDYWQEKLRQALSLDPTLAEAVSYFTETLIPLTPGRRFEQTNSLLSRLSLFADPIMAAQFGASQWAVPWQAAFNPHFPLFVFYDLSQERSDEALRFKMTFLFLSLVDYIQRWGGRRGGDRSHPVSVIIDEIAAMVGEKQNPLSHDLDRFINTYSRNYNLHPVTAFQEPYQLQDNKPVLDTLLSLGTKFYGRMTSPASSRLIADLAIPYDPLMIKTVEWRRVGGIHGYEEPHYLYYSKTEQVELGRALFDSLPVREFLLSRTIREGDKPLALEPFSLHRFQIPPPNAQVVAEVKRQLTLRDGSKVRDVLARIQAARTSAIPSIRSAAAAAPAPHPPTPSPVPPTLPSPAFVPQPPTPPREKRRTKLAKAPSEEWKTKY